MQKDIEAKLPLTAVEKRFLFAWQINPSSTAYNNGFQFELKGNVKISYIKKTISFLTQKHSVLRSIFSLNNGGERWILRNSPPKFKYVNIENCQNKNANKKILLDNFFSCIFNIMVFPPCCYLLLKINKGHYILAFNWHHIIVDAFSVQMLLKGFASIHNNFLVSRTSKIFPKTACNISSDLFQSIIKDEQEYLQSNNYDIDLNYWHNKIKAIEPISLPDFVSTDSGIGRRQYLILDNKLSDKLMNFVGNTYSSLFIFLATNLSVILFKYSDQEQMIIGYASTLRDKISRNSLGCFVNLLPLFIKISGNYTFKELIELIKLEKLQNQKSSKFPLIEIIKILKKYNKYTSSLPFNIQLNHTTSISFNLNLKNIKSKIVPLKHCVMQPQTDLVTRFDYINNKIILEFETHNNVSTQRFTQELIKSLGILIRTIIANPDIKLKEISIISEEDKDKLLNTWNSTEKVYPNDKTLHQLFEEQVARTPNNIAVIYQNNFLTYRGLNEQINKLSNYLKETDKIVPGQLVAICLDRSEYMVITVFAVLKAGGAYVPIDPVQPDNRIMYILNDTNTKLILTDKVYKEKLDRIVSKEYKSKVLDINGSSLQEDLLLQPIENSHTIISSNSLAYIIYTSGTTGQPKGVMIPHSNVVNLLTDLANKIMINSKDKLFSATSLAFDIAGLEIFLPLLTGARVEIAPSNIIKDGRELGSTLEKNKARFFQATPSMWQLLLDSKWSGNKNLIGLCGGEILSKVLAKKLLKYTKIWHVYGPTETTIWSTAVELKKDKRVMLGRPVANTKMYVLNNKLELMPIGVIGELYISGAGVAVGYLNKPELTSERFIHNPFQSKEEKEQNKNAKLYKSGDLVRWLSDGNLEYIGRNDSQVKIRGHRIELREIEVALSSYKGIKYSVVLVKDSINKDNNMSLNKYLIGYYISDTKLDEEEVLKYLHSRLPEYMVPSILVPLQKLPLTINGKLDKEALPDPNLFIKNNYVAPKNVIQKKLVKIWQNVLKVNKIGIYDNFLSLGGDSLQAMKIVIECQKLGVYLELSELYEAKDIAALSKLLSNKNSFTSFYDYKNRPETEAPISYFQKDVWHYLKVSPKFFNIPLVLRLTGKINTYALEHAINKLLQRHSSLRTLFIEKNKVIYQSVKPYEKFNLKVIDYNDDNTAGDINIEGVVNKCINEGFNLQVQIPFKFNLIKIDKEKYIFVLIMNHLVIDGWSVDIIITELNEYYNNFSTKNYDYKKLDNTKKQYIEFSLNYKDYIRQELSKIDVNELETKFYNAGSNIIKIQNKQLTTNNDFIREDHFKSEDVKFNRNYLKAYSVNNKISFVAVVLAFFKYLLYLITNQSTISINFPVTVRPTHHEKDTIGYFVNKFVITTNFLEEMTLKDILSQTQESITSVKKYQNIPFSYLIEQLNLQKKILPTSNIVFINQNINENIFNFKDLKIEYMDFNHNIIMHDLMGELYNIKETSVMKLIYKKDFLTEKEASQFSLLSTLISNLEENQNVKLKELKLKY